MVSNRTFPTVAAERNSLREAYYALANAGADAWLDYMEEEELQIWWQAVAELDFTDEGVWHELVS